jgi:hypothetical protein
MERKMQRADEMESATAEVKPLVSYSAVPRLHKPDVATIHRDYLRKYFFNPFLFNYQIHLK